MKKLVSVIALCALVIGAKAQKLKGSEVPAVVKEAFKKMHPDAKAEKWEKEGSNYEVETHIKKTETSLVFDAMGKLLETEVEIKPSDLPKSVTDYIAKNMPGKKVKEAAKITGTDGKISYEAEIDGTDYLFDSDGSLLKKEADTEKDNDKN